MEAGTLTPPAGKQETEEEPVAPPYAPEDGEQGGDDALAALVLDAGGQLTFGVGGKRPTDSSLRIVGGKIDVQGQYEKGQTITATVELVIGEVSFRDRHDAKTGQVTGCDRAHKARITAIRVASDE